MFVFLRSESSKTIIADRKEMQLQADTRQQGNSGDTMQKKQEKDSIRQILAIFKNKKSISVCDFAGDFQYRMASDQLLLCGKT